MPIPFTCPHCGRATNVADQYAGTSGPCLGCGATITIPRAVPPVLAQKPPVEFAGPAPVPSTSSSVVTVLIVVGVVGLLGLGVVVALLIPAVQSARESARRMSCKNNLKQIALALHNYHDVFKRFPAAYVSDENGKPMHSWRIAILPFIESSALYDQYNFNEPWDSPNNLAVAEQMPAVFRCPSAEGLTEGSGMTNYVVVIGQQTKRGFTSIFSPNRWARMADVTDGLANTLFVVESSTPVPWTKPDADLHFGTMDFSINSGSNSIGSTHSHGANVVFADGSVRFLDEGLDEAMLRGLIQPAEGMDVSFPYD